MAGYTGEDARHDLGLLAEKADTGAVLRLTAYIEELEVRAEAAERVCEAAAEVAAPTIKRDKMQQRQTAFLRALAEWREARK